MAEEGKVFDLFQNRRFRARLFERIGSVALAQIIHGRLDVNINLVSQPPVEWLGQLACTVDVGKKRVIDSVPVSEVVAEDGDFALLVTGKNEVCNGKEGHFPSGTTVTLTDTVTGTFRTFRTRYGNAA